MTRSARHGELNRGMRRALAVGGVMGLCAVAQATPLTLIDDGRSDCVVVYDKGSPVEAFAVAELIEIVKGTTGVELESRDLATDSAAGASSRILVGRNAEVVNALGQALLDSLKEQESLVTRRGGDLILTGGDGWGVLYAVYDFVENEAGYRCYAPYPGGEFFAQTNRLVYSGVETRRTPAFTGYRMCYTSPLMFRSRIRDFARFLVRNRGTQLDWTHYGPEASYANDVGLKEKYKLQVPGHSLFFYIPPNDRERTFWKASPIQGSFEDHPEYFSLDAGGKRVDNAQLCFSSPEMRRLFTQRVLEAVEAKGDGVYMIGSNDNHNQRYCWCPGCRAMEEKYNSTGGPLWDYILEICDVLKKDHPGVFITSLAYKGPRQTEKAPEGIRFPSNFICDAAFLNAWMTLKEIPDETLDNGEIFNKFENLKKWADITDHVAYWYYGGAAPYQVYERPQQEIRELRDAGVKSVGSCGLGSMEFGDITTYLYLRLLVDPDLDAKALVAEFAAFKYGAAAPGMLAFIDELEQLRRDNVGKRSHAMGPDCTYERMSFLEAEQLVRWQKAFDEMLERVREDPRHSRNVRIARTAVDCWTTVFMHKIRAAYPDIPLDAKVVLDRGRRSAEAAIAAGMLRPDRPAALKVLDDMSLYALLRDATIPSELQPTPGGTVIRYLPVSPKPWDASGAILSEDAAAAAQWAMRETIRKPEAFADGVRFEFYDEGTAEWLERGVVPKSAIVPGAYQLHKLFTARLPARPRLVFGTLWGSSLDIMYLGRYYDPSYHERRYEVWASLKCTGPLFDPDSAADVSDISCDQVFLVDKGMPDEKKEVL